MADVELVGSELKRPEGVMASRDGAVWTDHQDGHVTRIGPDEKVEHLGKLGGLPNGLCIDRDGRLIVANLGGGVVQRVDPQTGQHEVIADQIGNQPFTTPNFPYIDAQGRLWVTNSTSRSDFRYALRDIRPDGALCRVEAGKAQVVADGLTFANGIAMDVTEEHIYVAETMAKRITRFSLREDGGLGNPEQYGPELGPNGYPDGIAFDSEGNLWITLPSRTVNGIGVINRNGDWKVVVKDPLGEKLNRPTNICFGGPDLRTAYVGSLGGTAIARFRTPYPGLPLIHQHA